MSAFTIPEAFAATGILFLILAAVTFVAITTADQHGRKPELWRKGLRLTAGLIVVAAVSMLAAIWSSVLL